MSDINIIEMVPQSSKLVLDMYKDNKSVTINVPIKRYSGKLFEGPLNKMQKSVPKRLNRKSFEPKNMEKYTLPKEATLPINILKQAEIMLPFKQYSKRKGIERFQRSLAINVYDKYQIKSVELRKRLYVNDPAFDINSVTDIDEDYYVFIDGRPLGLHIPVFKSFKVSVNKILKYKHETGIKKNCVLNLETNHRNELDVYDLSIKRLTYQAKCFDIFISEDYKKSMSFLEKWDKLRTRVDAKVKELQNLAIEKFTIQSRLIGLEYKYSLQQKYGRFLYYLSPPLWRLNNRKFARSVEIEAKGFDFGNSSDEDTFAMIFEKLSKICYGTQIEPVLYFTQPKHLMDVFDTMENQQLHYYTHVNHLTPHIKLIKERIRSLKEDIDRETALVVSSIKRFEKLLNLSEDTCTQLESKFYNILYGLFYDSVGSPDVLKLITHLEFLFEKLFYEKPINMDLIAVAKCLENFYTEHTKKLDAIQSVTVRRAINKCTQMEKLQIKKAKHASKELRSFHRLEKELLRAHGIIIEESYTPLKKKYEKKNINRPQSKQKILRNKIVSLTEAEIEYLSLFTNWTETEDPTIYLQSLSLDQQDKPIEGP